MRWRKPHYGQDERVHATFKLDRDLQTPLMEYAKDQEVNKSDILNTLIRKHNPLKAYLGKGTHDTDDNKDEPPRHTAGW
ncbi:MAG: hypothetical protein ABIR46_03055 [Candidatus Saccharimonadales bacterium]